MSDTHFALTVTDDTFADEVLSSEVPVLVDFWAPWCAPCQALGPVIEELAEDYAGRAKVVKINIDDSPSTAEAYGVRRIPTLNFYVGGEVVKQTGGVRPKRELALELDALLA